MYSSDDEIARYSRGGEFLENLMCGNPLEFGRRWMGLGDIHQVIDDIREFYKFNEYTGKPMDREPGDIITLRKKGVNINIIKLNPYMNPPKIIYNSVLDATKKQELHQQIEKGALL
jgi:hypothetical protein